jgi:Methyltransferase domain
VTSRRSSVEDGRFEHVLLTQVLEHIPEPATVLAELNRMQKRGGPLWLTAPLFYAEHQRPYDYLRCTRRGLRHLLEAAGLGYARSSGGRHLGTLSYKATLLSRSLPASRARRWSRPTADTV